MRYSYATAILTAIALMLAGTFMRDAVSANFIALATGIVGGSAGMHAVTADPPAKADVVMVGLGLVLGVFSALLIFVTLFTLLGMLS